MASAYLDIPTFQQITYGVPTAPYIGGLSALTVAPLAGATTLTVGSTAGMPKGQRVTILDGPSTESTTITATTSTTLTIAPALTYAHNAGVAVSTPGTDGDLAMAILSASSWLENYCQQGTPSDRSLWSKSRTETLRMPSTRAYVTADQLLTVVPSTFPITSVTAATVIWSPTYTMALDITQIVLPSDARTATFALIQAGGSSSSPWWQWAIWSQSQPGWIQLTYTAGYAQSAFPQDIQYAAALATQEWLNYAQNPTGAAQLRQGGVELMQRLKGSGGKESSVDSILLSQAKVLLLPYQRRAV